ncbi:MAG: hypothetical protein E6Q06_00635 [Candidatus Moraniibacteriota bacterium]|nr:MAG: hypothetical protein E6Q06_00635 [Candidatus Moranbacteria bacterium]
MSLIEVNEELHRRSRETDPAFSGEAARKSKSVLPDPVDVPLPEVLLGDAWGGQEQHREPIQASAAPESPAKHLSRKAAWFLGGLALTLIVLGVIFKASGWLFSSENVQVGITGPKRVESNQPVEYVIHYENNNWVDLDNAELIVTYPEFFHFASGEDGFQVNAARAVIPIGTVQRSSQGSLILRGSFRSLQDQVALFTVTLRSSPKGISSRIDIESQYSVAIASSAVVIELEAPLQAGDGQFADYVATYRNESSETIENLSLVIEYPSGFSFRESSPVPVRGENTWSISSLAPGASGTVTVRGVLTGGRGDVKRVVARIGLPQGDGSLLAYAENERQTRIIASPLTILQKIGDDKKTIESVEPGEAIPYRIIFRNDGDVGLRDLIVTVDLDPEYFDVSNIRLGNGGTYSIVKRQAVFRAADREVLSGLEPGRSGEITFSVPVRSDLPSSGKSNIEIASVARIDSPDVPTPIGANKVIASNRIAFKVRTAPAVDLSGYHYDGRGNTGPIPPVVGQETTYTMNLRAASTLNAIEDARFVLSLPGQVRYVKTYASDQGDIVYNDRTGEIFWNIGTLAPGAGKPVGVSIQIGLTPDPSQVLSEAKLVNSAIFTGRDIWSGAAIRQELPAKITTLKEDEKLSDGGGKVQAVP